MVAGGEVFPGTVHVKGGQIRGVDGGKSALPGAPSETALRALTSAKKRRDRG